MYFLTKTWVALRCGATFLNESLKLPRAGALVYSRAGYGKSDPISVPRPIGFMDDEALITLPQLLAQLEFRNVILFGHSDGGSIALIHAATEPAVTRMILEAPHVFVEDISVKIIEAAAKNYQMGSLRAGLEGYHGSNVDCAFWGWNQVWLDPVFRSWNIEGCLPAIDVPVVVIQGEEDEYGTLTQAEAIEKGCAGEVHTEILAHCGHSPHRDQAELTLHVVKKFLSHVMKRTQ